VRYNAFTAQPAANRVRCSRVLHHMDLALIQAMLDETLLTTDEAERWAGMRVVDSVTLAAESVEQVADASHDQPQPAAAIHRVEKRRLFRR